MCIRDRACPFPDVIFPPLFLSVLSSSPFTVPCRLVLAKPDDWESGKQATMGSMQARPLVLICLGLYSCGQLSDCLYYFFFFFNFPQNIKIGLKGHPPVLEGEMYNCVNMEESTWCIEDKKVLLVNLEKVLFG